MKTLQHKTRKVFTCNYSSTSTHSLNVHRIIIINIHPNIINLIVLSQRFIHYLFKRVFHIIMVLLSHHQHGFIFTRKSNMTDQQLLYMCLYLQREGKYTRKSGKQSKFNWHYTLLAHFVNEYLLSNTYTFQNFSIYNFLRRVDVFADENYQINFELS